ncbi:MAG TPA: TonB-dependent receptor, partial [Steroidobacteraceae bacterium]|nr:TonB-dependent receptor [Steroidobacteraceae bacterium]
MRAAETRTLESLLAALRARGVDVIYSSELVPPDLVAPPPVPGHTALQDAVDALAAHGLALNEIAPNKYVVVRAPPVAPREPASTDLEEISVYASRYSIEGHPVSEPRELRTSDIEQVPGSHDDALRALHALPGFASNASGRPYIRGSLANDILFRYDGITLLDPFHLKNFQSLISAIDPAAVDRMEVFSGGFPVRYGTRSGGVIDIAAPGLASGYENRAGVSLISGGLSTMGTAAKWPLEWLAAIRHSTVDLIDQVEDEIGRPRFSDSIGRLRLATDHGAWTLGWLLLDDQLELGNRSDAEVSDARFRDEYLWLARDHEFAPGLRTRFTAVLTTSERDRAARLDEPGVALGTLDDHTEFGRFELGNTWTWEPGREVTWTFGAEASLADADYRYTRAAEYAPALAAAFDRPAQNDLQFSAGPRVFSYALHAAARKRWSSFDAEFGLRLDGQHYNLGGDHTQVSPRLNLRYDASDRLRLYTSIGRFTQAQQAEEWRAEEAQTTADPALVSVHSILGLTFEASPGTHWGFELYSKHWTTAAPYFDNQLDPLALTPDLAPDRVRIDPKNSEAAGFEVNLRHAFSGRLSANGVLSWARVADDLGASDILRSWDQPLALSVGLAWQDSRLALSALAGWHRGWPRSPV